MLGKIKQRFEKFVDRPVVKKVVGIVKWSIGILCLHTLGKLIYWVAYNEGRKDGFFEGLDEGMDMIKRSVDLKVIDDV